MMIGDMRRKFALERIVRVGDGGGGASSSWVTIAHIWASVAPLSGDEALREHRISGRVSHEIGLRYRSDVEPEMRLTFEGRVFHILAVFDPDGRRRWLKCLCEEREI